MYAHTITYKLLISFWICVAVVVVLVTSSGYNFILNCESYYDGDNGSGSSSTSNSSNNSYLIYPEEFELYLDAPPQLAEFDSDLNRNKIDDKLDELIFTAHDLNAPELIIVLLKVPLDLHTLKYQISPELIAKFKYWSASELTVLEYVGMLHLKLPLKFVPKVAKLESVALVGPPPVVKLVLSQSVPAINADDVWALDITGADTTIAVLDTGIDPDHPAFPGGYGDGDFSRKIVGWKDFINNQATPYDDNGHGTHCSNIAAGNPPNNYKGVAKDAHLVAVKVMNAEGWGGIEIIDGINWVIGKKSEYGIDVMSLSLGTIGGSNVYVDNACDSAINNGIIVCVAAGNEGDSEMGSPARNPESITVGACYNDGTYWQYSTTGPGANGVTKPEVTAPGVEITAAWPGGSYMIASGTSMACPHVAGVAALMRSINPQVTHMEVKEILKSTTFAGTGNGEGDMERGWGKINALDAINTVGYPPQITQLTANGQNMLSSNYITVYEDDVITFSVTATDPNNPADASDDGYITQYKWTFLDSEPLVQYGQTVTHSYPQTKPTYYLVIVEAEDNSGLTAKKYIHVTVINQAPIAEAPADQQCDEDEFLTLEGNAIDTPSDLDSLTYEWDFDSSDGIQVDAVGKTVTVSYPDAGTYVVTLTVTDNNNAYDTDSLLVKVNNVAPSAQFTAKLESSGFPVTPDNVDEDELIIFDAGASTDTESDIATLKYQWEFGDGASTDWLDTVTTTHTYTDEGIYVVKLRVKDDNNAIDEAELQLHVHNVFPTAKISPLPGVIYEGDTILMDASNSTDTPSDLSTLNYSWDFDATDGSQFDADAYGKQVRYYVPDDNERTITLTVRDDNGATKSTEVTITPYNRPPKIRLGYKNQYGEIIYDQDIVILENEFVVFNVTIDDVPADLAIINISWRFGDGEFGYGVREIHHKYKIGRKLPYVVTVIVTDNIDSVEAKLNVTVENMKPQVELGTDIHLYGTGEITFEPEVEDTENDLPTLTYYWDFGDGTTSTERTPTHVYKRDGVYKVTLTVTDDNKEQAVDSINVTVEGLKSVDEGDGITTIGDAHKEPEAEEEEGEAEGTKGFLAKVLSGWTLYLLIALILVGIIVGVVMFIRRKIADAKMARAFRITEAEREQREALYYGLDKKADTTQPEGEDSRRYDYLMEELSTTSLQKEQEQQQQQQPAGVYQYPPQSTQYTTTTPAPYCYYPQGSSAAGSDEQIYYQQQQQAVYQPQYYNYDRGYYTYYYERQQQSRVVEKKEPRI